MKHPILWRVASILTIALALASQGFAQPSHQLKLGGLIHHYTAALDANGPWHISGEWSIWIKGDSGKADFSAALSMVRADNPARQPHTHHIYVTDGDVVVTGTGFEISGATAVTGSGNVSFPGAPIVVQISGGNAVPYSNIAVSFTAGPSMGHFGAEPLGGVVTR